MRGFTPFAVIAGLVAVLALGGCSGSTSGSPSDPNTPTVPTSAVAGTSAAPTGSTAPATSASRSTPPAPVGTAVPADVPTTGPNLRHKGERPPVMPLLATKHTPAGATAFAKFFELTIDWGYATTSTAYMKHYYEASCITCKSIAAGLDKAAKQNHRFVGGRMTIRRTSRCSTDGVAGAEQCVRVAYQLTAIEVLNEHGVFLDADPSVALKDNVWLRWATGGWRVVEMGPIK